MTTYLLSDCYYFILNHFWLVLLLLLLLLIIFLLKSMKLGCKVCTGNEKIHSWFTSEKQYRKRIKNEEQQ